MAYLISYLPQVIVVLGMMNTSIASNTLSVSSSMSLYTFILSTFLCRYTTYTNNRYLLEYYNNRALGILMEKSF